MAIQWIRPDFEAPMMRVQAMLEENLADLRARWPQAAMWERALDATLEIARGFRRMARPQLVLLGWLGAGGDPDDEHALRFASGVELLHLFLLIHDDVMDRGTLRRGAPTLHRALRRAWPGGEATRSEHLAIVIGDLLHSRALGVLTRSGAELPGGGAAVDTILSASSRAGLGQFMDLLGWEGPASSLSPETFRELLLNKGGHHAVTAPLLAGWRLAQPEADLSALTRWGDHTGLAFQGLDDLQDVLVEPAALGKDNLQDIREGRLSMVGYLLREHLDARAWAELRPLLGSGVLAVADRRRIFHLIARHQIIDRGLEFVHGELDAAHAELEAMALPEVCAGGLAAVEAILRTYARRLSTAPSPI